MCPSDLIMELYVNSAGSWGSIASPAIPMFVARLKMAVVLGVLQLAGISKEIWQFESVRSSPVEHSGFHPNVLLFEGSGKTNM